ncbi:MAG: radical SAM protein [Deltaproteobacteria bacterium]|nr:radical SAM protein [Deltaproteobacteria bacterium]
MDFLLEKSRAGEVLCENELAELLALPPSSPQSLAVMAQARKITGELDRGRAEVHGQFALNLAPCPKQCQFCSFAAVNRVFTESFELSPELAVKSAQRLEAEGVNAVYMMTTAQYDFGKFLEMGREVKKNIRPETVLIANVGDRTPAEAKMLKDVGFSGVYHAMRLREGVDTAIDPLLRKKSIDAFQEAGLIVGTCVEPVGPEHTNEELAAMIAFTASISPAYSGAARRISIPGTRMALEFGMISELRMAQIVAVTRLGMPRSVTGNCTHEPCVIGALAGANLLWAEIGANPRDTEKETEKGRGADAEKCRKIFWEADCGVLEGPSLFYRQNG